MKKIVLSLNEIKENCVIDESLFNSKLDLNSLIKIPSQSKKEIDMKRIQNAIIPIIKDCDIFISYSHNDVKIANNVASFLMKHGYKVFIDSKFWDSIDEAQKQYDKLFSKNDDNKLNYDLIRKSASTFNMILCDSIVDTIKSSKVFLFITNDETLKSPKTPSPWLYLENKTANSCSPLSESLKVQFALKQLLINFPLNLANFNLVNSLEELKCNLLDM